MSLFLFRFWPVLLPFAFYYIWLVSARRKARLRGEPLPHFRARPLYWVVMASLLIAVGCFIAMGLSIEAHKGIYQPPHMENGKLVPAKVIEK